MCSQKKSLYFVKPVLELEPSIHWLELGNIERWPIFCEDSTPYLSLSALDTNYTEFKLLNRIAFFQKFCVYIFYLAVVAFQVSNILESCWGIQLDHITMNSSKEMSSITEWTLKNGIYHHKSIQRCYSCFVHANTLPYTDFFFFRKFRLKIIMKIKTRATFATSYKKKRPCHGFRRHLDEQANVWEITVFVWESNVQ